MNAVKIINIILVLNKYNASLGTPLESICASFCFSKLPPCFDESRNSYFNSAFFNELVSKFS